MIKYQKVIKVGNSLAVTLDKDFVNKTGLVNGQQMAVNYQSEKHVVSLSPVKEALMVKDGGGVTYGEQKAIISSKITPELEQWTEKFLKENKSLLEKLAQL